MTAAVLAAGCIETFEGERIDLSGQTVELTILHTSDIHSRLLPYDLAPLKPDADLGLLADAPPYGGVARLAALIKRERARSSRVIHLDSGDCFQGAPIFNTNDGEAEVKWLSLVKADGVVVGNHEFDKGIRNFADKVVRFATYPNLLANYVFEDWRTSSRTDLGRWVAPYTLLNQRGLRIAVIGMGNISSLNSLVEGGNSLGATPLEQNEVIRAYVELLRPAVDVLVVVSHLGLYEDQDLVTGYEAFYRYDVVRSLLHRARDPWRLVGNSCDPGACPAGEICLAEEHTCVGNPENVRVFVPGVTGLDVIMGGHLHVVLNPPQELVDPAGRKVILSHSGAFTKYLGRLDLMVQMSRANDPPERRFEGGEVVSNRYRVFPVDSIWCDDEARGWRTTAAYGTLGAELRKRPTSVTCRDALAVSLRTDPLCWAAESECLRRFDAREPLFGGATCDCAAFLPGACRGDPQPAAMTCRDATWANLTSDTAFNAFADRYCRTGCADAAAAGKCTATQLVDLRTDVRNPFEAVQTLCRPSGCRDPVAEFECSRSSAEAFCLGRYDRAEWDADCDRLVPLPCRSRVERCRAREDPLTTRLLQPYIQGLDARLALERIFAFAPREILRRNNATGGDSPLGNLTSESMRVRRRVEAEVSLTNSLGIRDSLYVGPVTLEAMFNVFPFENTINIMYLSGQEMQDLLDFVAEKSADRGCQSQAQVAGLDFTMDCFQAQLNRQGFRCGTCAAGAAGCRSGQRFDPTPCQSYADLTAGPCVESCRGYLEACTGPCLSAGGGPCLDACQARYQGCSERCQWECDADGACRAHTSFAIAINSQPLDANKTYKIAVNDYIAKGGSGFKVLKRNTTRIETGISLRDSLIDYMRNLCTCEDILGGEPELERRSKAGILCAQGHDGSRQVIDPLIAAFCQQARDNPASINVGRCTCADVLARNGRACGSVTPELIAFCEQPSRYPIAGAQEDGRIRRRVK